jgi:hypothetical protein
MPERPITLPGLPPGLPLYAVVFDLKRDVLEGRTAVPFVRERWRSYARPFRETADGPGGSPAYVLDLPADAPPGRYRYYAHRRADGAAEEAITDFCVGDGLYDHAAAAAALAAPAEATAAEAEAEIETPVAAGTDAR